MVHRKALPARACSELRLAGAHAVDNARGRQPGDSVQPEPPSTSPADDNPRSAAGRESSNMQMLSAGHIEETEMLQDSEQQTRAPSTSLQTPERAVTVDAQLSPPIFMGAGAEATPAARQPRRCKSCVRAVCVSIGGSGQAAEVVARPSESAWARVQYSSLSAEQCRDTLSADVSRLERGPCCEVSDGHTS